MCPTGNFYIKQDGTPAMAMEPETISKYVHHHFFSGDCPMGDELNTEGCEDVPLPPNYEMWIEVVVPESDNSSYGYAELELYRDRTVLHPGETVQ